MGNVLQFQIIVRCLICQANVANAIWDSWFRRVLAYFYNKINQVRFRKQIQVANNGIGNKISVNNAHLDGYWVRIKSVKKYQINANNFKQSTGIVQAVMVAFN